MKNGRRLERIGLAIGILVALGIVVAVFWRVLGSDQGPLEPVPTPEIATTEPTLQATPATPGVTFNPEPPPEPGTILHLLTYAPDRLADDSIPLGEIAQYADIQRWMASQGIEKPSGPEDPGWNDWLIALNSLALPEVLATRGTDPVWQQTYGFGLSDVHQVLAVGSAPDLVLILRGDFDPENMSATWAENGYQAVRVDQVTYWTLNPGGALDLSAPASRPALGNMNNLVLLDDGTLIATARADRLEQTLQTISDSEPSMAQNIQIESLLSPGIDPQRLVTAVILQGSVLEESLATPVALAVGTPAASNPRAGLLLTGLEISDANRPRMVIVAVFESIDDGLLANQMAIRQLSFGTSDATGAPYADQLHVETSRVVMSQHDDSLLIIVAKPLHGLEDWLRMTDQRDFGFLSWSREP